MTFPAPRLNQHPKTLRKGEECLDPDGQPTLYELKRITEVGSSNRRYAQLHPHTTSQVFHEHAGSPKQTFRVATCARKALACDALEALSVVSDLVSSASTGCELHRPVALQTTSSWTDGMPVPGLGTCNITQLLDTLYFLSPRPEIH